MSGSNKLKNDNNYNKLNQHQSPNKDQKWETPDDNSVN